MSVTPKLLLLFQAGEKHFKEVRDTLGNMSPKMAIDTLLAFTPPATTPSNLVEKQNDTTTPKNEVKIGDETLTGTPEEITAFNTLNDTAHKILGKNFKTETLLSDGIKKAKPEEKIALLGKELFISIVDALKAAYGNDFATKLDDKKVDAGARGLFTNFMDGTTKLDAKTLPTMNDIMNKTLEHIFWHGVGELEKNIVAWRDDKAVKDGSDEKFNDKIADKLLSSVK